jgi:hypothetical protein
VLRFLYFYVCGKGPGFEMGLTFFFFALFFSYVFGLDLRSLGNSTEYVKEFHVSS